MPAATTWFGDGTLSGFDVATHSLKADKIHLASGGNVDAQGITRMQYKVLPYPGDTSFMLNRIDGIAKIRIAWDDAWFAEVGPTPGYNVNNDITAVMYIVASSAFAVGVTPTVQQVMDAAISSGLTYRASETVDASEIPTNGYLNKTFGITGPIYSVLQPNTKYWITIVPVMMIPGQPATTAHRLQSFTNDQGRGVSLWTNRTPNAPVITEPTTNRVVASGALIDFSLNFQDADYVSGDSGPDNTDVAGVQVQYAPLGSSPTWTDLPSRNYGSTTDITRGWWILGSNSCTFAFETPQLLVANGTVQIKCGFGTPTAGAFTLPAGSWQIRARVFDWGHPYPSPTTGAAHTGSAQPLGASRAAGAYTADDYPAINTSPWSTAITLTVKAEALPPLLMYPKDNVATPANVPTVLAWQHRNSAIPSSPQASRDIQIRRLGDGTWTTLVSGADTSPTYTVTGFTLVSGNPYEWRARTTSATGAQSDWSQVATFWMVPPPASGGIRPVPSNTIDGATLGCGTHRVMVYRRGGKERVGELTGITHVDWNRVRDDISTAKIVVQDWGVDCGNLLSQLQCWAYELVIFRENGYTSERVWEGPITLLAYERDTVTVQAKDVMGYAYRRIIRQKMDDSGKKTDSVVNRAVRVLQNAFAPDDPNVLAYLQPIVQADDRMENRSIPAFARTAFEEVDDMASNTGLDYTAVGRAILLWGTKHRIGTLPEFRDEDLGNTPIVSEYGMSTANVYAVSDGNGIYGTASRGGIISTGEDVSGNDPTYGLVEMLSSSWASDEKPVTGADEDTQAVTASNFAGFAESSIASRYPPPVVVRIPDNTTLNPGTVISIQHLVPGVVIPLRSTGTLRKVVANQKLDKVQVVEEAGEETISITLSPFSSDDDDAGGGEGA